MKLEDGSLVDGGRVLIRDRLNSASYPPLQEQQQPQDMLVWKNRLSEFWEDTMSGEILSSWGIKALIFAGANTDQCV